MGRQVKRVPLDFEWPIGEVWRGFLMPDETDSIHCTACDGCGLNPATKQISDDWYDHAGFGSRWSYDYGFAPDGTPASRHPWRVLGESRSWCHDLTQDEVQALVDANRLHDLTHTWSAETGWKRREDGYVPTAAEVNAWSQRGFGHDAINQMIAVKARAKRLGVYGLCEHCNGAGHVFRDDAHRAEYEAWERSEPPTGDGWQMWETTSEGSPISPVMRSPEELAAWLTEHEASAFGSMGASYESWLAMIREGWAPSMVLSSAGLQSGVDAAKGAAEP